VAQIPGGSVSQLGAANPNDAHRLAGFREKESYKFKAEFDLRFSWLNSLFPSCPDDEYRGD
jgi:hypothetical protein